MFSCTVLLKFVALVGHNDPLTESRSSDFEYDNNKADVKKKF